jgi:hypothetical protein
LDLRPVFAVLPFGSDSALKHLHRLHADARNPLKREAVQGLSCAITGKYRISCGNHGASGAHADRPAVTRKNKRLQVVARIRMTCASGSRLISPRAGAHIWGKGARILTEINRLPHYRAKFPPNFAPLAAIPVYLTRKGGISMQLGVREASFFRSTVVEFAESAVEGEFSLGEDG